VAPPRPGGAAPRNWRSIAAGSYDTIVATLLCAGNVANRSNPWSLRNMYISQSLSTREMTMAKGTKADQKIDMKIIASLSFGRADAVDQLDRLQSARPSIAHAQTYDRADVSACSILLRAG
jgi:hypothetical protein